MRATNGSIKTRMLLGTSGTFEGTTAEAELIFHAMQSRRQLSEKEDYILRRYLGLFVPENLVTQYDTMTDEQYRTTLKTVLAKIPAEVPIRPEFN